MLSAALYRHDGCLDVNGPDAACHVSTPPCAAARSAPNKAVPLSTVGSLNEDDLYYTFDDLTPSEVWEDDRGISPVSVSREVAADPPVTSPALPATPLQSTPVSSSHHYR